MNEIAGKLAQKLEIDAIRRNEDMSKHCSFKAGGISDLYVEPENEEELIFVLKALKQKKIKFFILGKGSNVLFTDKGFRGCVISLKRIRFMKCKGNKMIASASISLKDLSVYAKENALTGLEFAYGIPGSVGGAVYMNAGAYGYDMKQVVEKIKVLDPHNLSVYYLEGEKMELDYRHSIAQKKSLIVLSVYFKLQFENKEKIAEKMFELKKLRKEKQPLEFPSAGSTFKRPDGYYAGKLIQDCGLKGFSVGGAKVSEKHSGFVINYQQASASDIVHLIEHIQSKVYERFQVKLKPEICIIGDNHVVID